MSKRKYIFIVLGLLLVLFTVTCSYLYLKYREYELKMVERAAARYHLLCEVLKPGMSMNEVLGVLHQVGDFKMNTQESVGDYYVVGIFFTDPKVRDTYGDFALDLSNSKYNEAFIQNFDQFEGICHFPR